MIERAKKNLSHLIVYFCNEGFNEFVPLTQVLRIHTDSRSHIRAWEVQRLGHFEWKRTIRSIGFAVKIFVSEYFQHLDFLLLDNDAWLLEIFIYIIREDDFISYFYIDLFYKYI